MPLAKGDGVNDTRIRRGDFGGLISSRTRLSTSASTNFIAILRLLEARVGGGQEARQQVGPFAATSALVFNYVTTVGAKVEGSLTRYVGSEKIVLCHVIELM